MCNPASLTNNQTTVAKTKRVSRKGAVGARRLGPSLSAREKKTKTRLKKEQFFFFTPFARSLERKRKRKKKPKMALSSRLRPLLLAAVAALLLAALAPRVLAANTLMAVDLGGEFMKVREEVFLLRESGLSPRSIIDDDGQPRSPRRARGFLCASSLFLRSILMHVRLFDKPRASRNVVLSRERLARAEKRRGNRGEC